MPKFFRCPNCGAEVPINAKACPECGSDEETGWSEAAQTMHLLPRSAHPDDEITPRQPWTRYVAAGLAGIFVSYLLAGSGFGWILYILCAGGIGWGLYTFSQRSSKNSMTSLESHLRRKLIERTQGDKAMAERLIEYERARVPEATQVQLIQSAIERLQWDRSR